MGSRPLSLSQYLKVLLKRLPLVLIMPIIAAGAAYLLVDRVQSPHYVAEAQMLVTSPASQLSGPNVIRAANEIVPTYVDLGRSDVFLREVSESHDLGLTASQLRKKLDFINKDDSLLITVKAQDVARDRSILLANTVAADLAAREATPVPLQSPEDVQRLQGELSALTAKIELAEADLEGLTEAFASIPPGDTAERARLVDQINVWRGNVQMWRSDYGSTLDALRDVSQAVTLSLATQADSAQLIEGPSRKEAAVTAGLVGLLLGIGIAFLMWYTDSRLCSREDVERALQQPVLAETGRSRSRKRGNQDDEDFRHLYARLDAWKQGRSPVVVAVASAALGSDVSLKLARAAASTGDSVILVTADPESTLVNSDQARAAGGLAALCSRSDSSPDKYLSQSPFPLLRVISVDGRQGSPPASLAGMKRAFRRLANVADLVVVDARPSGETSALVMAGASDATILVVQADRTDQGEALNLLELLRSFQSNVIGVVLDGGPEKSAASGKRSHARRLRKKEKTSARGRVVEDGVPR